MIELNLRSTPARSRKPPQRYFGSKGVEATVSEVGSEQQRKQYAWALATSSGPGTPAPFGFNAKGKPIKKKRKKTRSKQKNLKKDNRPKELKPDATSSTASTLHTADAGPLLSPLEALLMQLHRENPQYGAKRLTRIVRDRNPELAKGTKEVRRALARALGTKRAPKGTSAATESRCTSELGSGDEKLTGAEDAAAVAESVAKAVAAAEVWAREHSSSGSDDDLERRIVAAAESWSGTKQANESGTDDDITSGWWLSGDFRRGGPDYCDCRLPPTPESKHDCFCCVCGKFGHSRLECSAAPTEMPAADQDYVRTPGGGASRKRTRSGEGTYSAGPRRKRRPHLWEQIQEAAHIPVAMTRSKRPAAGGAQQRRKLLPRQKNGKVRDEGPRPKGGWAPKPKRTVFGKKKKTSKKQQRSVEDSRAFRQRGADGCKHPSMQSRKERRAARRGRNSRSGVAQ